MHVHPTAVSSADAYLTQLYHEHYAELVRVAALLLDDTATAEEIVQDAFVTLFDSPLGSGDAQQRGAEAHLRRLVVRRARSLARRRRITAALLPAQRTADARPADVRVLESLEQEAILHLMAGLPARQREVLILRYYGELSEAEIAEAMGVSRGSVKTHAFRGLSALREAMGA